MLGYHIQSYLIQKLVIEFRDLPVRSTIFFYTFIDGKKRSINV